MTLSSWNTQKVYCLKYSYQKEHPQLDCESYLFTINYLRQEVSINDETSFRATKNTIIQSIQELSKIDFANANV